MLTREQLLQRAAREIEGGDRAFFGAGLPSALRTQLGAGHPEGDAPFDVAFVEALEIAADGQIALAAPGEAVPAARRIVAVLTHNAEGGSARIVPALSAPASALKATRVISDRGVIDVTPAGLVLREVPPGESASDVQQKTDAPLFADASLAVIALDSAR